MKPRIHRAGGNVQNLGNLGIRQALDFAEAGKSRDIRRPIPAVPPPDRAADPRRPFRSFASIDFPRRPARGSVPAARRSDAVYFSATLRSIVSSTILASQVFSDERPSNLPIPRYAARKASCTTSSASELHLHKDRAIRNRPVEWRHAQSCETRPDHRRRPVSPTQDRAAPNATPCKDSLHVCS